eukprot:9564657-Alexandrium_andersonii.AAC.1
MLRSAVSTVVLSSGNRCNNNAAAPRAARVSGSAAPAVLPSTGAPALRMPEATPSRNTSPTGACALAGAG